jgi:hypothetical protein
VRLLVKLQTALLCSPVPRRRRRKRKRRNRKRNWKRFP